MKVRRHLVILGMVFLALGAFAPPGQSQTTDWVFSANYTANGDFFSCSNVPFTLPLAGGSTSFACDIAAVSVTVNIAGLTFSVSGFGNVSFDGISCSGTGGGGSSITVTDTGFFTVGTISGNGICTSEFGDFPFTVSGTYDASGGSAGALSAGPAAGLTASGDEGGPFSPPSRSYTLTNTGGATIGFGVSKGQSWVSLSKTGGTLSAGASTSVLVAINSNATVLDPGPHSDTVSFTNTTNGQGNTSRPVNLTVNAVSVATVTSVSGDVRIIIDGNESPLTSSSLIPDGAVVVTGNDGLVELTFANGSRINLESNATLQLASPEDACTWRDGKCLKLLAGKVRALIQCAVEGDRYCARVRTTAACACVRGTDFSVEHKQAGATGRTTVEVFTGTVEAVDNDGNITVVNAGQRVSIPPILGLPWLPLLLAD